MQHAPATRDLFDFGSLPLLVVVVVVLEAVAP